MPTPMSSTSSSKAAAASKIHSLAEKRRRERINAHLSTLRTMIPHSKKTDKASLLGEVVNQVKHLKKQATHIISRNHQIPVEADEVIVEPSALSTEAGKDHSSIRASICCEDRPGLLRDIVGAFDELGLRTVRAELATLGGRVRSVFLLREEHGNGGHERLASLEDSVRETLVRVTSVDGYVSCGLSTTKRARLLQSHFCADRCV